jgi:hypothetical protein
MIARTKRHTPRNPKYYRLLTFHIDPELDVRISQAASLAGITISDVIRNACAKAIASDEEVGVSASSEKAPQ